MKVLLELNLARNKIHCKGAIAISKALIYPSSSNLTRLNLSQCGIKNSGMRQIFEDLRTNHKLTHIILDENEIDNETFSTSFGEFLYYNKTLLNLSLAKCQIEDTRINSVIEGLTQNEILKTLNLSSNGLTNQAMKRFKQVFEDDRKRLSLRCLDLSSNFIEDEGGVLLIQAIQSQDNLEELNLRNNLVKDRTARAII